MGHKLITAATQEPITVEEVKDHLRIETSDEDGYLIGLIQTARDRVEDYLSIQMVSATWELSLDDFPANDIELPRWPLSSITSVKYTDINEVEQTVAVTVYEAVTNINPGKIRLKYNQSWPVPISHPDSVLIRYVSGYGNPVSVPPRAKHCLKLLIGHWFENREPINIGNIVNEIPYQYRDLVGSLKVR